MTCRAIYCWLNAACCRLTFAWVHYPPQFSILAHFAIPSPRLPFLRGGPNSNRGIAEPRTPPTREYQGHSACLPDGETLQRQACHGGSRQMGCQRRTHQLHFPGIIVTPLAIDEFNGPRGDFYRNMFAKCPARRPGTADEIAHVAELLMGGKGTFITGADFLIDGGATASYFYGPLKPHDSKEKTSQTIENGRQSTK